MALSLHSTHTHTHDEPNQKKERKKKAKIDETKGKQQIMNVSLWKNNKHFPKLDTNSFG